MKNSLLLLMMSCLIVAGYSQPFKKLGIGTIVSSFSDSRSINIVDVNNDGWDDIFISNGLQGGENNLLYINDGRDNFNPKFTLDQENIIGQDASASVGATFGDWDNDGDLDAYVTNWYGDVNQWYQNKGDGQFEQVEAFNTLGSFSETAALGDYNNDGFLDLYVTNSEGSKKNFLFKNINQGDFQIINTGDATSDQKLSRNANWTDYDGDGDLDLYVSNENNSSNDVFRNEGESGLVRVSQSGIGNSRSSMSSSWGDIDNDGDLDLVVANAGWYQEQTNLLYRNDGDSFTPLTDSPVSTDGGCSYGSNFADYDNDGDLDLIILNGFCNNNLKNFLYENQGDGTFVRLEDALPNISEVCSYGAAWGDLNNDGFQDLVIANCKNKSTDSPQRNEIFLSIPNDNHWLKVKLEGTTSNRSAIGAKVRAKATISGNPVWQMREISSQSGYCGQNSLTAHMGFGDAIMIDSLIVEWPSGMRTYSTNINVDQQLNLTEGMSTSRPKIIQQGFLMDIYPNPAQQKLQIRLSDIPNKTGEKVILSMLDLMGKEIWRKEVLSTTSNFNYQLNMKEAAIASGSYMLKAQIGLDSLTKKVILH